MLEEKKVESMKDQTNKANVEESEFFVNESSSLHEPLLPGDVVGEFVCQGIDGEQGNIRAFSSQDLINNHCIFVFYRSNFTETSTELINMFYKLHEEIKIKIHLVSTESVESNFAWIDQNWKSIIPFIVISDKTGELSKKFGVLDSDNHSAYNAAFIINKNSKVEGSLVLGTKRNFSSLVDHAIKVLESMTV